MVTFTNKHGRKPGRGVRPWLLMPKLFCVATYFGGLVGAMALLFLMDIQNDEVRTHLIEVQSVLFRFSIVPGLIGALLFGAALLYHHGKPVWQMRWMRVKLVIVVISVPIFHTIGRILLTTARETEGAESISAMQNFRLMVISVILVTGLIMLIGRHKPRFGQSFGKRT